MPAYGPVTDAHIEQYNTEGFCLLESVVPEDLLEIMRDQAQVAIDHVDQEMENQGVDVLGINIKGSRYFSMNTSLTQPSLFKMIHSDLMADITRSLIGDEVNLFWEQYVIKGTSGGAKFAWHQDSAYVPFEHAPYLTCWITLDDMSEANGTARILPYSRGASEPVEHIKDPKTNDLIGYQGEDPGDPVICPAGSIACFSSLTLHCSGANTTDAYRRTYLLQYSAGKVQKPGDMLPYGRYEPLLVNGKKVFDAVYE